MEVQDSDGGRVANWGGGVAVVLSGSWGDRTRTWVSERGEGEGGVK